MRVEHHRVDQIDLCLDIALEAGLDRVWLETKGRNFEFGDDPDCVDRLIEAVRYLLTRLQPVVDSIDLGQMCLAKANKYFLLKTELDNILEWLEQIEDEQYGRSENTKELKKRLGKIMEANIKVWQLLNE